MSAIQNPGGTLNFGSGRLFQIQPGGFPLPVKNLTDIGVDFKVDLKTAFAEGAYPIGVADSHREIDITAKYFNFDPAMASLALNATTTTGATNAMALDEPGTVDASAHTYQLAQHATYVAGTLYVLAFPLSGSIAVPTSYAIVTSGLEVAGASCSVSGAGLVTFAAGDASVAVQCSYKYGVAAGTRSSIVNQPQNSSKSFQLVAVKRDTADLDNSTAQVIATFYAVRGGGAKSDHKEGDYTIYESTFKAYANGAGKVYDIDFVNV